MNNNDNIQILIDLGLATSQAKVYLALLILAADSKGTVIAKFAGIPRQDVYRVLAELNQIGIVQKTLARPAMYRSVPPKEALSILLERKIGDFAQLKTKADIFIKNVKGIFSEQLASPENDQFILISERGALTSKARDGTENIKRTLNEITPFDELVPWLTVLSQSIDRALARGVKIRWITEKPANTSSIPKFLLNYLSSGNVKIRFVSKPIRVKIGILDSKEVILGIFTNSRFACSPALWSNNPPLIAMAEAYFETLWKTATNLRLEKYC